MMNAKTPGRVTFLAGSRLVIWRVWFDQKVRRTSTLHLLRHRKRLPARSSLPTHPPVPDQFGQQTTCELRPATCATSTLLLFAPPDLPSYRPPSCQKNLAHPWFLPGGVGLHFCLIGRESSSRLTGFINTSLTERGLYLSEARPILSTLLVPAVHSQRSSYFHFTGFQLVCELPSSVSLQPR